MNNKNIEFQKMKMQKVLRENTYYKKIFFLNKNIVKRILLILFLVLMRIAEIHHPGNRSKVQLLLGSTQGLLVYWRGLEQYL